MIKKRGGAQLCDINSVPSPVHLHFTRDFKDRLQQRFDLTSKEDWIFFAALIFGKDYTRWNRPYFRFFFSRLNINVIIDLRQFIFGHESGKIKVCMQEFSPSK